MSKTINKKKFRLNPFAIAALVLCVLIVLYCGTTAWITGGAPLNPIRFTQLQDFSYDIEVLGIDVEEGEEPIYLVNEQGNPAMPITYNKDTIDKIDNLRVNVTEVGNGIAYVRVKVSHEWLLSDGTRLQGALDLPLEFSESFYDNRDKDGYIYYKGAMPVNESVAFITGFDSANFDVSAFDNETYGNMKLRIDVYVDAVQFNRYRQIWGIDGLPWRNTNA